MSRLGEEARLSDPETLRREFEQLHWEVKDPEFAELLRLAGMPIVLTAASEGAPWRPSGPEQLLPRSPRSLMSLVASADDEPDGVRTFLTAAGFHEVTTAKAGAKLVLDDLARVEANARGRAQRRRIEERRRKARAKHVEPVIDAPEELEPAALNSPETTEAESGVMHRARVLQEMLGTSMAAVCDLFRNDAETLTAAAAIDALREANARPPAPINVQVPQPKVDVHVSPPVVHVAAAEAPQVTVNVPEQRARAVRITFDPETGEKVYLAE